MPRIRTVKPDFFKHYDLFRAERETGLPLRVAFAGLWTCCDREGRFRWRPEQIKLDCLPFDEVDFSRVLDALATRGFVVRYEVDGEAFGWVPKFKRHQVINNREGASELPEPPVNNGKVTRETRVNDACPTPLKHAQAEGKGREGDSSEAKASADLPIRPNNDRTLGGVVNIDMKTALFREGLDYLKRETPRSENALRSLLGRWCKEHGHGDVFAALVASEREHPIDPVAWIEGRFRAKARASSDYVHGTALGPI